MIEGAYKKNIVSIWGILDPSPSHYKKRVIFIFRNSGGGPKMISFYQRTTDVYSCLKNFGFSFSLNLVLFPPYLRYL